MKYKKLDLQCNVCKKKFNFEEELENQGIDIYDDYAIFWCSVCGEQTFVKHKGFRSKKIDY